MTLPGSPKQHRDEAIMTGILVWQVIRGVVLVVGGILVLVIGLVTDVGITMTALGALAIATGLVFTAFFIRNFRDRRASTAFGGFQRPVASPGVTIAAGVAMLGLAVIFTAMVVPRGVDATVVVLWVILYGLGIAAIVMGIVHHRRTRARSGSAGAGSR